MKGQLGFQGLRGTQGFQCYSQASLWLIGLSWSPRGLRPHYRHAYKQLRILDFIFKAKVNNLNFR